MVFFTFSPPVMHNVQTSVNRRNWYHHNRDRHLGSIIIGLRSISPHSETPDSPASAPKHPFRFASPPKTTLNPVHLPFLEYQHQHCHLSSRTPPLAPTRSAYWDAGGRASAPRAHATPGTAHAVPRVQALADRTARSPWVASGPAPAARWSIASRIRCGWRHGSSRDGSSAGMQVVFSCVWAVAVAPLDKKY